MDPTDPPGYAGRIHGYFAAHPDRFRLMNWGQLDLADNDRADPGDPMRATLHRKTEQLRAATSGTAGRPPRSDLLPTTDAERASSLAGRRAAIVAAVQRLVPTATGKGPDRQQRPEG